jgi:hypothetical protein
MKRYLAFGCYALIALMLFISCGGETVKIDYRMNVAEKTTGNYFKWTAKGASATDSFDAATGASKLQTTERFDRLVSYDIPENAAKRTGRTIPGGLRSLFLFPVADDSIRVHDTLAVTANGKQLTVRYVHRDSAYEISTDANGKLDVENACKIARGVAVTEDQQTFILKPEFSKSGQASANMSDFDWSKANLQAEVFDNTAKRHYTGKLDAAFENNNLTIKGELKEVK